MDYKIELEQKGEKVANYLRVFLTIIFIVGTILGYQVGNVIVNLLEFYIIGIAGYMISFTLSFYLLRTSVYKPSYKYYTSFFEYLGFFILLSGYWTINDMRLVSLAVQNLPLHGVHYLLIISSILRFSSRFTITSTIVSAGIFLSFGLSALVRGANQADPQLTIATVTVSFVFIVSLGIISTLIVVLVNRLFESQQKSETLTLEQKSSLEAIVLNTGLAIGDLNKAVHTITNSVSQNKLLTTRQQEVSKNISIRIQNAQAASESIAQTSKKQHEISSNNGKKVQELENIMSEVEIISNDITKFGHDTLIQAKNGESEISLTVNEMENIKSASEQVSQIVSVINEIAGQTDLLALNAAIEAARAGENGRGFAVVAEEVGKLALQSGKQARQIETLVSNMKLATQEGVTRINSTVVATSNTINGVKAMVNKIESINSMLQKQLTLTRDVLGSMLEIQKMSEVMYSATDEQTTENIHITEGLQELQNQTDDMIQSSISIDEAIDQLSQTSQSMITHNKV